MGIFASGAIKVFDEETSSVLHEWKSCPGAKSLMAFEIDGKEYLLEGCDTCGVIRGYESPEKSHSYTTFCETTKPNMMCSGNANTIIVFENGPTKGSIRQLRFDGGKFLPDAFSFETNKVKDMTFSAKAQYCPFTP